MGEKEKFLRTNQLIKGKDHRILTGLAVREILYRAPF